MCVFTKVDGRKPRFSLDGILNFLNFFSISSNKRGVKPERYSGFCSTHFCNFTLSTCRGSPFRRFNLWL